MVGNAVVVSAGGPDGYSLVAYDKESGDDALACRRRAVQLQLAALGNVGRKTADLIINRMSVAGHDPADGHILWQYEWPQPYPKCAEPLLTGDDTVLVSAGYGLGSALLKVVPGSDGEYSVEQVWADRNLRNLKSKFASMMLRDG